MVGSCLSSMLRNISIGRVLFPPHQKDRAFHPVRPLCRSILDNLEETAARSFKSRVARMRVKSPGSFD